MPVRIRKSPICFKFNSQFADVYKRQTIYWLLANIYRIEGREEQEIDCLKKAAELGYNLFTAQKARQILKDKGITVKNMPIAPVELPKVKYIKPLLCIATACLPCIWFIITHF